MSGITDPSEQYFKDGGWSWNGSIWIKGGLPFEYASQVLVRTQAWTPVSTIGHVFSAAVAANEIWVVTAIAAENLTNTTTERRLGVVSGGVYYFLAVDAGGAALTMFSWGGQMIAVAGQRLVGRFLGGVWNDLLELTVTGYKMRLT